MTIKQWRGQEAVLSITDSESTDVPVGVLQEVEIEPSREVSELYGAGSIKRQDVQQTELSVDVSGTVSGFDTTTWDSLVGYDSTGSEITDSSTVPLFTVTGTFSTTDGTTKTIEVSEVYFESVPFGASRDEWIELDLDGTGKDITITNT